MQNWSMEDFLPENHNHGKIATPGRSLTKRPLGNVALRARRGEEVKKKHTDDDYRNDRLSLTTGRAQAVTHLEFIFSCRSGRPREDVTNDRNRGKYLSQNEKNSIFRRRIGTEQSRCVS